MLNAVRDDEVIQAVIEMFFPAFQAKPWEDWRSPPGTFHPDCQFMGLIRRRDPHMSWIISDA
jgi:hypothetical protein